MRVQRVSLVTSALIHLTFFCDTKFRGGYSKYDKIRTVSLVNQNYPNHCVARFVRKVPFSFVIKLEFGLVASYWFKNNITVYYGT